MGLRYHIIHYQGKTYRYSGSGAWTHTDWDGGLSHYVIQEVLSENSDKGEWGGG